MGWLAVPAKYGATVISTVSFFVAWLTVPAKYGESVIFAASLFVHGWLYQPYMKRQDTKMDIFAIHSTCMEISVSLSCLFVHEPPYQTTVVCCNLVFHRGRSHMDHPTIFMRFPCKCGARSGSPQLQNTGDHGIYNTSGLRHFTWAAPSGYKFRKPLCFEV